MRAVVCASTVLTIFSLSSPVHAQIVNPGTPAPECTFHVNYDRNADLPGYLVAHGGVTQCLPFMPTNRLAPAGASGEWYVSEFTDAKIRARWADCQRDPACRVRVLEGAKPFIAYEKRVTGALDAHGPVEPEGNLDLATIRRPGFFGRAPYAEPVAALDQHTSVVEFTVPRDSYERRRLGKSGDIRLRGWYVEGTGVDDGSGKRTRALVIMNNGGGSELTAIDDPRSPGVVKDRSGAFVAGKYPDALSEQPGMRYWRGFLKAFADAGFDVLVTDRRGNGISGGVAGFNTAEQANDMFRELEQMQTGQGMRALTPSGQLLAGARIRGHFLGGQSAQQIPVVLMGYSRGSYATAWAMHKNFVADCDRDVPDGGCQSPRGWTNIKGAILYGPNSAGLGYRVAGHDLIEAALREEYNTTYYVDSEVYAGISRWPAIQIVKGTWCYVEGLEGSLEAYRRGTGLKDIFVFRGPHELPTQAPANMAAAGDRMARFAVAAATGAKTVPGATPPADLKALVTSSQDVWEVTTAP